MARAWAWLYLDTAPAEKPYLAGLATDQRVVPFQTLNAHESRNAAVLETWRGKLLFIEVPGGILEASCELYLILSSLRAIAYALYASGLLHQPLVHCFACLTAQPGLLKGPSAST